MNELHLMMIVVPRGLIKEIGSVCVCVRERECARERETERDRERESEREQKTKCERGGDGDR